MVYKLYNKMRAAFLLLILVAVSAKKVIELTDANFEHDTQASTGATTGDWLVAFTDGRKEGQTGFDEMWGQLAAKLSRRVSVAHVDLGRNQGLKTRFSPVINRMKDSNIILVLLRRGKYFVYGTEGEWTFEKLGAFAIEEHDQAAIQGTVPAPPSAFDKFWEDGKVWIDVASLKLNNILMKNQETGEVNYPAVAIAFGLPFLIVVMLITAVMYAAPEEEDKAAGKKQAQKQTPTKQMSKNKKN